MKKLLFSLAVATVALSSCKKEETNTVPNWDGDVLKGDLTTEVTLQADIEYKLEGTLSVKDGGVLRIPAGTVIKAKKGFAQYVIVERGGKIYAEGSSTNPITFTSAEANPAAADWGGLIINGYAPISGATSGTEAATEVNNDLLYGGTNTEDNSGVLNYVILEYTGARSNADVEHNGLTLNAVGSGTKIQNLYIPHGADDGVEFFGGSVNVKNLLVVNPDDDMFDVTQGWTGTLDNAYGVWEANYVSTENDPRGVEADGNLDGKGPDHVDQSNFKMMNITIENNATGADVYMHDAIKVRRGATATLTNILVKGSGTVKDLIDLTDSKGDGTTATTISVTNALDNALTGSEVVHPAAGNASVEVKAGNTGANTAAFVWTGYFN